MACNCSIEDLAEGTSGTCKATVIVTSECKTISLKKRQTPRGVGTIEHLESASLIDQESDTDPEIGDAFAVAAFATPIDLCRITYTVEVTEDSNASVTELAVGDDVFQFPAPIAPGKKDTASKKKQDVPQRKLQCVVRHIGKVRISCGKEGAITLGEFAVCVLTLDTD